MNLINVKYEGGPANGYAQAVTPNCQIVYYGPERTRATRYVRTDRTDPKGRVIFKAVARLASEAELKAFVTEKRATPERSEKAGLRVTSWRVGLVEVAAQVWSDRETFCEIAEGV